MPETTVVPDLGVNIDLPTAHQGKKVRRLLMLYDAPSGLLSAIVDSAKKMFGHGCNLCAITHGLTGKRPEWAEFEKRAGVTIDYLHQDELMEVQKKLGNIGLPAVVVELEDGNMEVLLSHLTIKSLEELNVERLVGAMKLWANTMDIELSSLK